MIVYQIVTFGNRFDYNLDDYVCETGYGKMYTTKEEAEKHRSWFRDKYDEKCDICEVMIYEKFDK